MLNEIIIDNYSNDEFDVHLANDNGEINDYYTRQGFDSFTSAFLYVQELVARFDIVSIRTIKY